MAGLVGFAMDVVTLHGTAKLGQDKPEAARMGVADALDATGARGIAAMMRTPPA
jgi:transcriptional regulator